MIKKLISNFIKKFLSKYFNKFLERRNSIIIFRNGSAIGDHVYMSSIIREIFIREKKKIYLFTNYYEFYLNNPRVRKIFKINKKNFFWFFLRNLKGKSILEFDSLFSKKNKDKHFLFFHKKNIHLAQAMSEHFNLNIKYENLKNEFFFSKNEIESFKYKIPLPKKFSLIQSTSKKTFTKNKEWKINGMQNIVNSFENINWVQIGKSGEPILKNCKTVFDLELREIAYVIYKCNFLVTYEGLFNHIASCFNKKNFLIHTGFLPVEAFFYQNNILVERNSNMNCYPCFKLNCKSHIKDCEENLKEEFVINKIRSNIY